MRLKTQGLAEKSSAGSIWLLVLATALSLVLWNVPVFNWILGPISVFVTTLHELGHAIACLATGGQVSGLTIVSDNQGHGGLTFCSGGIPFIYTQAGYLGTAVFGCIFLLLGRSESMSRFMLFMLGCLIGLASLSLMLGTIFSEGRILEGVGSIVWGLALAGGLVWCALNLRARTAHFLFFFLAFQTALNAVTSAMTLLTTSFGIDSFGSWSDATTMQKLTMIPAQMWALGWAAASIVMVLATLWWMYGRSPNKEII
ncbi:MAG: M50 family metallopeptidase [Candidatus Obscuribacterales bacterium]|nr:M50 family metallopeptidase [Candidatus Obscuribacterales bacterium]